MEKGRAKGTPVLLSGYSNQYISIEDFKWFRVHRTRNHFVYSLRVPGIL